MYDGKILANNIHYARQSGMSMTFSADEIAALSSYISMLEKSLIQYVALQARRSVDGVGKSDTAVIETLVRDIEVALEGIKLRMAPDGTDH